MIMLEHSKRKFLIIVSLTSKLVNYQNRLNVKFSVGKSKQYYNLTAELVDPNYLKLSRLNRLVGKS